MSSAILYVAIVAIWIGVLVPQWLRHEHARDGHLRLRRFSTGRQRAGGTAVRADFSEEGHPRFTSFGGDGRADRPQTGPPGVAGPRGRNSRSHDENNNVYVSAPVSGTTNGMSQPYETDVAPSQVRSYGWSAEEYLRQDGGHERAPHGGKPPGESPAAGERRARIVRGRRRMLWMLLVLTVAAVSLAYLGLGAWWIAVPPAVLLAGYLLLLREAADADAEARERKAREWSAAMARRAREASLAADAQRGTGTGSSPAWPAHETLPPAEIIDISERVGDQLYDQYADAQLRAVGD